MAYINTKTKEYPLTDYAIRKLFPNVSFSKKFKPPVGFAEVTLVAKPTFDKDTQKVVEGTPTETNGKWSQVWDVVALDQTEIDANKKKAQDDLKTTIKNLTQKRLDDFAATRGYGDIMSACTYATSTNAKFKAEGQYCVGVRDQTWAELYTLLSEVEAGTKPQPTSFADVEPSLPALAWPQ